MQFISVLIFLQLQVQRVVKELDTSITAEFLHKVRCVYMIEMYVYKHAHRGAHRAWLTKTICRCTYHMRVG